jgi:hypothetical protein
MKRVWILAVALAVFLAAACGDDNNAPDSGVADGGVSDGGTTDGGVPPPGPGPY